MFFNGITYPNMFHAFMERNEVDGLYARERPTCQTKFSTKFVRDDRLGDMSHNMIFHVWLIKDYTRLFTNSLTKNSQESQAPHNSMHGLLFGRISPSKLGIYMPNMYLSDQQHGLMP